MDGWVHACMNAYSSSSSFQVAEKEEDERRLEEERRKRRQERDKRDRDLDNRGRVRDNQPIRTSQDHRRHF